MGDLQGSLVRLQQVQQQLAVAALQDVHQELLSSLRKDWVQAKGGQLHDVHVCDSGSGQAWDAGCVEVVL